MTTFIWVIACAFVLGLVTAPFPYWPSYFYLWKVLLRSPWKFSSKFRLAGYLVRAALRAPFFSLFWYLDEILYRGYHKRRIQPVFIVGQPRCGTTFLHRTLGADEETFFTVKHIEWRYPSIALQKFLAITGVRAWLLRSSYWSSSKAGKLAAKMHPNKLSDPEEDGIFFEENYLHHFFLFLRFPDGELLEKLNAFSRLPFDTQQRMLLTHRKCIQKVAYLRGEQARIYLSKEVTSHNKIRSLMYLYPDARFIISVRPVEYFLPSLAALMKTSTRSKTGIDVDEVPGWLDAMVSDVRQQCNLLVDLCEEVIPMESQVRISAMVMMTQVVGTVSEIYRFLSTPLSTPLLEQLREIEESQRTRKSGYSYEQVDSPGFERYNEFVAGIDDQFRRQLENRRKNTTVDLQSKRKSA